MRRGEEDASRLPEAEQSKRPSQPAAACCVELKRLAPKFSGDHACCPKMLFVLPLTASRSFFFLFFSWCLSVVQDSKLPSSQVYLCRVPAFLVPFL